MIKIKKIKGMLSVLQSAAHIKKSFRPPMWLLNASVIVMSITLASILPAQPTPNSSKSLISNSFSIKDFGSSSINAREDILSTSISPMIPPPSEVHSPEKKNMGFIRSLNDLSHISTLTGAPYIGSNLRNYEIRIAYRLGTIKRSLLEDGREAGLPDSLIFKLAEIFGWDIDFALDLHEGDRFLIIYEEKFWFGQKISDGNILAAEFINGGKVLRAVGFRSDNGKIEYFTPSGVNLRRLFLRTPVQFSSISSRYSKARYHPILKVWRSHNGVDYIAPRGTPVRATASGHVASIGWSGGYGNRVLIRHTGPYSTLYAHLSQYRPGLKTSDYVEQGEIIGYVGNTGLATGPHLHYEFQINGQHQNPLAFESAATDSVAFKDRTQFLDTARLWVNQFALLGSSHLAAVR